MPPTMKNTRTYTYHPGNGLLGQLVPYKNNLAVQYTRARMEDDIRRHVLHLTDRKHLAHQTEIAHSRRGGGAGVSGGRGGEAGGYQECPSTKQPD